MKLKRKWTEKKQKNLDKKKKVFNEYRSKDAL